MLKSQKVQLRLSELKERINGMELTKDNDREFLKGRADLVSLEAEYRAEVEAEERETGGASFDSGETAEVRGLIHRASAAGIISAVALHRISDGAEGELQRALGVGGDVVPWALMEKRGRGHFHGEHRRGQPGQVHREGVCRLHSRVCGLPSGHGSKWRGRLSNFRNWRQRRIPDRIAGPPLHGERQRPSPLKSSPLRNRYQASFAVREQDLIAFSGAGEAVTEELTGSDA